MSNQPKIKVYRVKDWNDRFESAKSRTYKIKSQSYMPNKQGLGYNRMMRLPDGCSIYGAWCAMINLLSRMEAPRHGYLTDTGLSSGMPYDAQDIAALTLIKDCAIVQRMIDICSSQVIGWLEVAKVTDTALSLPVSDDGPSPLPLPLPLPLPNKTTTTSFSVEGGGGLLIEFKEGATKTQIIEGLSTLRPDYQWIQRAAWEECFKVNGAKPEHFISAANAFIKADANSVEPYKAPARYFAGIIKKTLEDAGVQTETHAEKMERIKKEARRR